MDLFSDLVTAVQSDLTVGSESTLFDPTTIKLAINRAYRKAGGVFRWSETEDAKKTSTVISSEYYDYPDNWRPNTIWKLKVDGIDYGRPLVFKDYLYEQENSYPSGKTKLWSNQWRRFFIDPVPTTNGNNNIEVWGQKVVDAMVNDSDVTIFSYSMPECNEAIVMEALAILKYKGEIQQAIRRQIITGSEFLNVEAQGILAGAFHKVQEEMSKYEKTEPYLSEIDFFPSSTSRAIRDKIGDF